MAKVAEDWDPNSTNWLQVEVAEGTNKTSITLSGLASQMRPCNVQHGTYVQLDVTVATLAGYPPDKLWMVEFVGADYEIDIRRQDHGIIRLGPFLRHEYTVVFEPFQRHQRVLIAEGMATGKTGTVIERANPSHCAKWNIPEDMGWNVTIDGSLKVYTFHQKALHPQ